MRNVVLGSLGFLLVACAPKTVRLTEPTAGTAVELPAMNPLHLTFAVAPAHLLLAWVEPITEGSELRIASYDGSRWSEPVPIARSAILLAGGVRGPHLVPRRDGSITVCWFEGSDLRITTSRDGGRTWTTDKTVRGGWRDATSLAFGEDPQGRLVAGWVQAVTKATTEPIQMALVSDESSGFREARAYGQQLCADCGFSLSFAENGAYMGYRRQSPARNVGGNESTIVLVKTDRGGRTSDALSEHEGWKIAGDPARIGSGPVVGTDGKHAITAWYTAVPQPSVVVMLSSNNGRSFIGYRIPASGPASGFVASWSGGVATVAWAEGGGIRAMRIGRNMASVATTVVESTEGTPWLGAVNGTTYLGWREPDGMRLVRLGGDASP